MKRLKRNAYAREWYLRTKVERVETLRAYARKSYAKHREKKRAAASISLKKKWATDPKFRAKCYARRRAAYAANPEKERARKAAYRLKAPDETKAKIKAYGERYRIENHDKLSEAARLFRATNEYRAYESARKKRGIASLSDRYIRAKLTQGTALKAADIPRELIEVKREQLLLTRALNETTKLNPNEEHP